MISPEVKVRVDQSVTHAGPTSGLATHVSCCGMWDLAVASAQTSTVADQWPGALYYINVMKGYYR